MSKNQSRSDAVSKPLPAAIRRADRRLAADLKTWRKLRGLTQVQLADRAGISRTALSRLEHGGEGVSLESFMRVLRALGVLDDLIRALDPYESDVGRLRSGEQLPIRIRPSELTS
ncbi:MAG TPA: helix-turn-helix transcriptional regulator [Solirubrobacterales bacterium]|nr:helix-turn-helix transcriptional regulator [Solirubrobacterales bacterium]